MAKKRDFNSIKTSPVYSTIDEVTAQPEELPAEDQQQQPQRKERKTYSKAEQMEYMESLKTAGRKGIKLQRINMAFTPENYQYIKTMSQARGQNMTEFINVIIHQSLEQNRDVYEKAIDFLNSIS